MLSQAFAATVMGTLAGGGGFPQVHTPYLLHNDGFLGFLVLHGRSNWLVVSFCVHEIYCTHTHPFNGSFSGTTQVSQYQKGKTNLDFTEARGSGISWAICKSASRSRQITMPAPHHIFYRLDALPATQPTALKEIYCKVSYKYTAECKTKLLRNNNTTVNMYFGFSSYSTHTLVTVHFTPQRKQSATSHAVHFNVSETFTNKKNKNII